MTVLSAVFVIENQKVISEYRKEHKYQRFDLARILIDTTNGNGIQIHTSIFQCDVPKKNQKKKIEEKKLRKLKSNSLEMSPKSSFVIAKSKTTPTKNTFFSSFITKSSSVGGKSNFMSQSLITKKISVIDKSINLNETLKDPNFLKFFKLFSASEFSSENVIFYEEVQKYKIITDPNERVSRADQILKIFFTSDSIYEINTSRSFLITLKEEMEENCSCELFDEILKDVMNTNLSDTFQRFRFSDLYIEMQQKQKKKSYLLYK